jgi:hypothetical protein
MKEAGRERDNKGILEVNKENNGQRRPRKWTRK